MDPPPSCPIYPPHVPSIIRSSGRVSHSSGRSHLSPSDGPSPSSMVRRRIMRALAYLFLLALSVHLLLSYVINNDETGEVEESSDTEISPLAAELCQYLELKDTGVEGEVNTNEYKLKGVAVVFRHGERSPIVKDDLSEHHDCGPFRDKDRRSFDDYMKILDSNEFKKFLKYDKELDYPLYPPRSECSPGNLTAEGSLQLSRLGNHLRKAYEKSDLFNEEERLDVKVTVSPFKRTFQSAVAFVSSFLFPMKGFVDEVFFKYSNYTFHCTDPFCQCSQAVKWREEYEKQHLEYFLKDTTGLKEKAQRIFSQLETTKNSTDPFNMMDVLLGRYVCRRYPLPCTKDGECVSFHLLKEMLEFTTRRGLEMFNAGNEYIAARLVASEAQAILGYVARMGEQLREFPHTNRIKIFSGHDTTIGPILRTLRIPFVDFPRYASHIVFEIYHDGDRRDFLRLIYNGHDRTAELPFCGGKNMCPMSTFSRFSRSGIFAALGFSNVTQLCNLNLTAQPNNAYV